MGAPEPQCLLRPGDWCRMCQPGAHGPEDCQLVALVLSDPDLKARLDEIWREHAPAG
ncbi:DUF6767 domain-containing protein [Nocardioides sp. T2.26MG-1]|uniref:DUF6767 domain-containing protein n=1 Tax=Nocardioides sp. T2.26MG-1 TaxID=3041166 RepID=UPI0025407198|nr:DUF6767 domain-containing protein [Nocardioides sp. T2.26MG-1]